jgi:chromosome segregation ATPase
MAEEPENLVLQLLRGIRADMATKAELAELRAEMATKAELAEVKAQVGEVKAGLQSLRADVAAEQKATREQIAGLRRAVVEYHSAVIGHGALISELEARVRRVEQHLGLPALDAG